MVRYGSGAFPSVDSISSVSQEELRSSTSMGYRAATVIELARIEASGQKLENLTRDDLLSIKGLSPYSVDHIAVLQGDHSRIPVDSEVRAFCSSELGIDCSRYTKAIQSYFSEWEEYRFLAYKLTRIVRRQNWIGSIR